MADDEVRFGVLGPLEVWVDQAELSLGTPKQRAVLGLLIIGRNRPVGMETLIDAVWHEQPPEGARRTVHAYMSNLRRLLRSAGVDSRGVLARVAPGYRLTAAEGQCDIGRFLVARKAGLVAAAAGQFERAGDSFSAALQEWRGPVLADLRDFRFAEEFAAEQAETRLGVHCALADAEIACGRAYSVIGELEALTVEHPYREPIWAQLITAYYVVDRQSDALDAYHRLKRALAEDLGIDPGPALRAIYHSILLQLPLEVQKVAQSNAEDTLVALDNGNDAVGTPAAALCEVAGRRYPLVGKMTRIGRGPDNDIVISDAEVSRYHAVIVYSTAAFVITDLGSVNGVYVAGRRIRLSAALTDGDRICLGGTQFSFEIESGPQISGEGAGS